MCPRTPQELSPVWAPKLYRLRPTPGGLDRSYADRCGSSHRDTARTVRNSSVHLQVSRPLGCPCYGYTARSEAASELRLLSAGREGAHKPMSLRFQEGACAKTGAVF